MYADIHLYPPLWVRLINFGITKIKTVYLILEKIKVENPWFSPLIRNSTFFYNKKRELGVCLVLSFYFIAFS